MIRIAVPENELINRLILRTNIISEKYPVKIIKTQEENCSKLLINNLVEVALLTPLGYGKGTGIADFRIIPGNCITSIGYTGLGSIYFRPGQKNIKTLVTNSQNEFLMLIGKIMLAERYNIYNNLNYEKGELEDLLKKYDTVLQWKKSYDNDPALDISEEWYLSFETSLPVYFWVCQSENIPENIIKVLNLIFSPGIENEELCADNIDNIPDDISRTGKLSWLWNEETEQSLEQVIQVLYFHQHLQEIGAVKILGRD